MSSEVDFVRLDLPDDIRVEIPRRRRSTLSSNYPSTTSGSSPEYTTDSIVTPDSENEETLIGLVVPKIEESDEAPIDELKPAVSSPQDCISTLIVTPRKRGRPRKHPVPEEPKKAILHARSKTGCATCRRRKKKCDEARPTCENCRKNNVICEGYEPKQQWRSGVERNLERRRSSIGFQTRELPMLVDGVDGQIDQLFFRHFTVNVSKVLPFTDSGDERNPFLSMIVPMALSHRGLMHSLLYLSASCLVAREKEPDWAWQQRQGFHGGRAISLLNEDIEAFQRAGPEQQQVARIGDPTIAQTLLLCLQTVCVGDTTGQYRYHLGAMKHMLTQQRSQFKNEQLRQFIYESLIYHDIGSSISSLENPLDHRTVEIMNDFRPPKFMIQPEAASLLGVMNGLFVYISSIRRLRDRIRARRAKDPGLWWDSETTSDAIAIDGALREWDCLHESGTPRYIASQLYRQCTWIYLHRTTQPSHPSLLLTRAVDDGLYYLDQLPFESNNGDDGTQNLLLMPLFLLGCAAFEPHQRPPIEAMFQRLQLRSSLGNIKYAKIVVDDIWRLMDQGRENDTWDWEAVIFNRGWDFLVT